MQGLGFDMGFKLVGLGITVSTLCRFGMQVCRFRVREFD